MAVLIDNYTCNCNEETVKVKNKRVPFPAGSSAQTPSTNDTSREPSPTKVSSPVGEIVASLIQCPHLAIPNYTIVRMTLNLSDLDCLDPPYERGQQ